MNARSLTAALLAGVLVAPCLPAQDLPPGVARPQVMIPIRDYMAPTIAPIRLTNSSRLYTLIRAGNLYLSAEDAIALAIENNLNLEISRYIPQLAQSALQRAKAADPSAASPAATRRCAPSTAASASTARQPAPVSAAPDAAGAAGPAAMRPSSRSAPLLRISTPCSRAP